MASDASSSQQIETLSKTLYEDIHLGPPEKEREMHVVMVPYFLQGHINPMMQFAKSLIAEHRVRVTLVNNKHNHERIQHALATTLTNGNAPPKFMKFTADTDEHKSKLQLVWLDNVLPPDPDLDQLTKLRITASPMKDLIDYNDLDQLVKLRIATSAMKDPFKHLLQSLNQKSPHVSCVVFGSSCTWAHSVAVELGIPSIFFWTQSTSVFSIYHHASLLAANGFFPYNKKSLPGCTEDAFKPNKTGDTTVSYIPGVPSMHMSSFPTLLHIDDLSDPLFASMRSQFGILKECDGVIINSFEELEGDASQAIQRELPFPRYLVGPLIPSAFLDGSDKNDTSVGASLFEEKNDCINWLDSQTMHSVLYVSFGSIFNPPSKDLEAIACGIKASRQPFLWVIRTRSSLQNVCDILPKGFIEDTKEYGLIIPWAPQMQVLSHPSIGAFLTHCGWNSTLESLSMGVPMITFPLFSDQPTNCTYVCDVWKVGMALRRQIDDTVTSEGVERVVRIVMHEEEGKEMRKRASKLRETARQAVVAQGSSSDDIENFILGMKTQFKTQCKM